MRSYKATSQVRPENAQGVFDVERVAFITAQNQSAAKTKAIESNRREGFETHTVKLEPIARGKKPAKRTPQVDALPGMTPLGIKPKPEAPSAETLQGLTLWQIANRIRKDWKKINFAAAPYLDAMGGLDNVGESFGYDSGKSVVIYFLGNASGWRGATAKAIKSELKRRTK